MVSSTREEEIILDLNLEKSIERQQGINNKQKERESLSIQLFIQPTFIEHHDMSGTALGAEKVKISKIYFLSCKRQTDK